MQEAVVVTASFFLDVPFVLFLQAQKLTLHLVFFKMNLFFFYFTDLITYFAQKTLEGYSSYKQFCKEVIINHQNPFS